MSGAVNCLFNDMVRTNSSLVAGLNYSAYRAALQQWTRSSQTTDGCRRGIRGALALVTSANPREG